jgi:L-fuculose-phosphate aldolase
MEEAQNNDELRAQLVEACHLLQSRFLIRATGGNVSGRIGPGHPIWMTASGIALSEVTEDHLLKFSPEGEVLECPPGLRQSYETLPHLAMYKASDEAGCVVHVHPPHATAYASAGMEIPLKTITAEVVLGRTPVIPIVESGTERLSEAIEQTARDVPDARCFLLKEHGLILREATPRKAFHLAELVEECAQTAWILSHIKGNADA